MVNTVTNSALRTLLGAQNASSQNSLSALKNNAKAREAIVTPFQQNMEATTKAGTSQQITIAEASSAPPPSNLPRGSLVDILA